MKYFIITHGNSFYYAKYKSIKECLNQVKPVITKYDDTIILEETKIEIISKEEYDSYIESKKPDPELEILLDKFKQCIGYDDKFGSYIKLYDEVVS